MSGTGIGSDLVGKAAGGRKLIAVVYADMVGYSRLIGLDDAGTLRRLRTLRRALIDPAIREHGGKVVQTAGDSLLVVFDSIDGAVRCAVNVQQQVPVYDGDQQPDRRIRFRVGINIGDVIAHGTDLHGDGVNIAARLEAECPVGGICVSRAVHDHVHGRLGLQFEAIGLLALKNIARPVEAFVLRLDPGAPTPVAVARLRPSGLAGVAGVVVVLGVGAAWWIRDRGPMPVAEPGSSRAASAPAAAPAPLSALAPTTAAPALAPHFTPPDIGLSRAPPLSIVVLPFTNIGGDPAREYLVDGITDDLTTDLAGLPGTFVIARNSAMTYKDRSVDAKHIGEELGVRYALEGSIRRFGDGLRVNADLVSTESGQSLWGGRFDMDLKDIAAAQDEIVARIGGTLNLQLVDIESARAVRERPSKPQSFDLILQARALTNQPPSRQRLAAALAFYEQALKVDPSSVPAMLGIADTLTRQMNAYVGMWIGGDALDRAASLIDAAQALAPNSEGVMVSSARLLEAEERWPELILAARRLVEQFPNRADGYDLLSSGYRLMGQQDLALPLYAKAMRLDPRGSNMFNRLGYQGFSLMMSGRYKEAIASFESSFDANPKAPKILLSTRRRVLGCAYALDGQLDRARQEIAVSDQLWPFNTVRMNAPYGSQSPAFAEQIRMQMKGTRLAGQRDHATEDYDRRVPPDDILHSDLADYTPINAPGTRGTITTQELKQLLDAKLQFVIDGKQALIIDAMSSWWGLSLPGAVGLKFVGLGGGDFGDTTQERLRKKLDQLTGGDRSKPIVAVGFNSERFDGYNLALRLVHLGFTEVYWYRGGREAWEVTGLPEQDASEQPW